jgi:hypothetical protein
MALNSGFHIFGEVWIDGSRRICGKESDTLRDRTMHRLSGMKHSYGPRAVLNDDFLARTHVGQERLHVGRGGFLLRDVDHILRHTLIIQDLPNRCGVIVLVPLKFLLR